MLKVALNTINKYNQTDFVFVGSTRSYCFQNQDKNNLASRFSSLVLMCLSALNIKTYDGNYIDLFTLKNINCCVCFFNLLFIYLFIFCFVFFVFFCFVCVCVLRRDILTSLQLCNDYPSNIFSCDFRTKMTSGTFVLIFTC